MELFNETKNKYYDIITDLIFLIYNRKRVELKNLHELIPQKLNNNIKLKNSLLNYSEEDSLFILDEEDSEYFLSIDSGIPIILSKIEKVWLKYMLSQDKAKIFLNKETIDKILISLEEYEDIFHNNIIIKHMGNREMEDQGELKNKINILINAIRNNKLIMYSYKTREGIVLKNKISVPYKVEYSIKKDLFYLISYSTEEERPIKSIVNNFIDIEVLEKENPVSRVDIKNSIKLKKQDKYVLLEFKNVNNVIERGFLTFASYSTEAKYIEDRDIHELSISYYSFEEKEIINKIFSLGKGVLVKEPENIKNKIIQRIEDCLILYKQ